MDSRQDRGNRQNRGFDGQPFAASGEDHRSTTTAIDAVRQALSGWEGVTEHQHRFGGIEFRVGRRELGHLHRSFADLPFPRAIRDDVIAAGRARPHHVLPDSGWVTVPMRTASEVANVIDLLRKSYQRAIGPLTTGAGSLHTRT
jgi:hypothetical protein